MPDVGGQHVHDQPPPQRAPVTPRVRTSPASGAVPLERVVQGFVDAGATGAIFVHAPRGGGKTTALNHLRRALPQHAARLHLVDEPKPADLQACAGKLVVVTGATRWHHDWLTALELVPWAGDEWVEYLAANHRPSVASVMARLRDDATRHALAGSPQLWTLVLDAMASDPLLATARDALRGRVLAMLPDDRARIAAGKVAAGALRMTGAQPVLAPFDLPEPVQSLLRHHFVRLMLAADWLVSAVASGGEPPALLARPMAHEFLVEAGAALREDAAAPARLAELLQKRNRTYDAAAASLLLAADPDWRPRQLTARLLRDAHLDGAQWDGIDLRDACLTGATLRAARLREAELDCAKLTDADCCHADLAGASLSGVAANDANFTDATLRDCDADGADFSGARLENADLESARLNNCDFGAANLTRANLRGRVAPRREISAGDPRRNGPGGRRARRGQVRRRRFPHRRARRYVVRRGVGAGLQLRGAGAAGGQLPKRAARRVAVHRLAHPARELQRRVLGQHGPG